MANRRGAVAAAATGADELGGLHRWLDHRGRLPRRVPLRPRPSRLVQGLTPERVINIGTVSKSLAPTLRLGWLLCPPGLVEAIADLKIRADRGSPGLDQLVLARLIESGRFDQHLRRMRKTYADKRDALVAALNEHAPDVRLT